MNSILALAGVAILFVLMRLSASDPNDAGYGAGSVLNEAQARFNRFAFASPGALRSLPQVVAGPQLKPTLSTETESSAGAWSTEIKPDVIAPPASWRFTLLPSVRGALKPARPSLHSYTLKTRLAEVSPPALMRLAAKFDAAKVAWPPSELVLIAIKDERALELHARSEGGIWTLIHRYRVLAASGGPGPKLRQGDRQVPEGIYGIAFLNPNSAYHLSLRVNYPNAFDRQMAAREGRRDLGGDIMIHGKNLSAGCLAIGDEAVEELFVLTAQTGLSHVKVIIAPTDFREKGLTAQTPGQPQWLPQLYAEVATAMTGFKKPRSTGLLSFFSK